MVGRQVCGLGHFGQLQLLAQAIFDEIQGTVEATLEQSPLVPYVGIGLGNLSSGFGLYMDIGVSYSSESTVVMNASGALASAPGITEALQREADQFLADAPQLLTQLYPTVQIGFKLGL